MNFRAQYAKNAEQMAQMAQKARQTGRKVNGYTAEQLDAHVAEFRHMSTCSTEELRAILSRSLSR